MIRIFTRMRRGLLISVLSIMVILTGWQAPQAEDPHNPSGHNKKVLVILIRHQVPVCPTKPDCGWNKVPPPSPPRHDAQEYEDLLNEEINAYYAQATYNKTSFDFDVPDPTRHWTLDISPHLQWLQPGESGEVSVSATSPGSALAGSQLSVPLAIYGQIEPGFLDDSEYTEELLESANLQATAINAAAITCNVEPQQIETGQRITISGRLDPLLAGEIVALEYTTPANIPVVMNLTSDESGAFAAEFLFRGSGLWRVKTYWQGDPEHAAAESPTCLFILGDYEASLFLPAVTAVP